MSIYSASNKYDVDDLRRLCERGILSSDVPPERLVDVLRLAHLYDSVDLMKSVSYSISKDLPATALASLFLLAKELNIDSMPIRDLCVKALESSVVNLGNIFELLALAQKNSLSGLLNHCHDAISGFTDEADRTINNFLEEHPEIMSALYRERRRADRKRKLETDQNGD